MWVISLTSDVQGAARTHWQMLKKQEVSNSDFTHCLRKMMGDHTGSPFYYMARGLPDVLDNTIFHNQPSSSRLREEWRESFEGPGGISEQKAARFLRAIYNSLEEVDKAFTNQISPGTTLHKQNDFGDFVTRRPHSKHGWSLQLTTKGKGRYNCIREQFVAKPGSLVLLSPDALYDYQREQSCKVWEHQWVYFPQEERWLELLQWPEIGPEIYHIQADDNNFEVLKTLFTQIYDIHLSSSEYSQQLGLNLFEQVLIRCRQMVADTALLPIDKRVRYIKDYITRNFNQVFTAASLAAKVGLSPARLSNLFRQQTGSTMMGFRDERRMARAAQLLAQTRKPVNQIAQSVGYSDALYFSRCFNQHLGCSPSQYRNQHELSA